MNLVTECQAAVAKLDAAMAPLLSKKETQLALLHDVLNERLQLWCDQFDGDMPMFEGERGIGFLHRFETQIFSDEKLVDVQVEGDCVVARFNAGMGIGPRDIVMTMPMRYLDVAGGIAAILADANAIKAERKTELAPAF